MSDYDYRVSLIVPAAQVDAARRIASAMGWGDQCYSVAVSADGREPITHWGLSSTARGDFLTMLQGAGHGTVPDGTDHADLGAVMPVLKVKAGPSTTPPVQQFDELCSELGLARVTTE